MNADLFALALIQMTRFNTHHILTYYWSYYAIRNYKRECASFLRSSRERALTIQKKKKKKLIEPKRRRFRQKQIVEEQ